MLYIYIYEFICFISGFLFHYRVSAGRVLCKLCSLLIFCTCLHICTTSDVESDIDFLTVAGQDMQDLQRPPAPLAWVLCAAASSRFVPLFFASFRNCFDVRGSISWRTRAWPATKRVQRGTRGRSTCTAKSAGRKVRRAGELCQSTVSTFVTASDAKSSGCTASHRCMRGRES